MLLNIAESSPAPKPAPKKSKTKAPKKPKGGKPDSSKPKVRREKRGTSKAPASSDAKKGHAQWQGKKTSKNDPPRGRGGKGGRKAKTAQTGPKRNVKTVKAKSTPSSSDQNNDDGIDFLQQMASISRQIDSEIEPLVADSVASSSGADEEEYGQAVRAAQADRRPQQGSAPAAATVGTEEAHQEEEDVVAEINTKKLKNVAAKQAKAEAKLAASSKKFGSRKHPNRKEAQSRKDYRPKSKKPFHDQSDVARSSDHIFSESKFGQLGLCKELVSVLEHEDRFGFKAPTHVQRLAVPAILRGRDVIVKSETGSGKTLSFLLPVVELLLRMRPNVSRKDGTYCMIIAPTRELALQIFQSLQQLIVQGSFYWLVAGQLAGGEKKKSEKARLRKGLNFLVATPGRLLDHLQTTATWEMSVLKWLILDEVDRLLDMGFGPQIGAILDELRNRGVPRNQYRTIVTSATVTDKVEELTKLALQDPEFVDAYAANDQEESSATASEGEASSNASNFSTPKQLRQYYVEVACRDRLTSLVGFIRRQQNRDAAGVKMVVFFSTCDSVDFHTKALQHLFNTMTDNSRRTTSALGNIDFLRLHGNISQLERKSVLQRFTSTMQTRKQKEKSKSLGQEGAGTSLGGQSLVLLCTDVAARGLNLPAVDWIVQFDPPSETREYVHRVGRTARSGGRGQALLFLLHSELGYLQHLEQQGLHLKQHGDPSPRVKIAVFLQQQVVKLVEESKEALGLACAAYQAHSRAYAAHSKENRKFFNVRELHLGHLAQSFGLKKKPSELAQLLKSQNQSRKMRANNLQGGHKGQSGKSGSSNRGGFKLKPTSHNAANYKRKKSGAGKAKERDEKGTKKAKRSRQDPALQVSEFGS